MKYVSYYTGGTVGYASITHSLACVITYSSQAPVLLFWLCACEVATLWRYTNLFIIIIIIIIITDILRLVIL